jgi:hypothetical protein
MQGQFGRKDLERRLLALEGKGVDEQWHVSQGLEQL